MQNGSSLFVSWSWNASWGWIMFSSWVYLFHLWCHLEWYFAITMDFRWLVLYSLPALVKSTDQKSPKQMVRYLYDRLQNHQVVTDCFGCHILWLLARSNSTCRQRRCGRKRCWIDYPCPETDEQLNICSWWCMVPGTWYCIVWVNHLFDYLYVHMHRRGWLRIMKSNTHWWK